MQKKTKVLLLSDHPLVPSGVGTQAKYLIEGLLATGRYRFVCLGGAMQHPDYKPQKIDPERFGDDWIIYPVDGYGDKNKVREMLVTERPDVLVFITDPRFYVWLWEMEDEVRSVCPMVYWHVWDNDPSPQFNKVFYDSTDHVAALSLKTKGMLDDLGCKNASYIPHGLPADLFKPLPQEEVAKFKMDNYGPHRDKQFIVFWNNRNARRKVTGDVIAAFSKFAKIVGRDKVALMMHTSVGDPEGQDVIAVAKRFGCDRELIISEQRLPPEMLNFYYNVADCTINIASNEGFGLATLESLFAGTPIIAHFTGGLQYQVGDWWHDQDGRVNVDLSDQDALIARAQKMYRAGKRNWWGVPVFPGSRSCTGSQQIPYIYDDRVHHDDVVEALTKLYKMGRSGRKELGLRAREWATRTFSLESMISAWDRTICDELERFRSSVRRSFRIATI